MMNSGQGRNAHGPFVQGQADGKPVAQDASSRGKASIPLLFEQSECTAQMKWGNVDVVRRRIDRRRIRDSVNGRDEQQQTDKAYGPFRSQIVLNEAEACPLPCLHFPHEEHISIS